MTEIIDCRHREDREEGLERAGRILRDGKLVAFPTETVYGLGADATEVSSVRSIFEAKDRPPGKPLIVHVESIRRARELAAHWSSDAQKLAEAFWPGPLSLIVEKSAAIPDLVTGGLPTVGIRAPDHPIARGLIEAADRPVAAPSANPHKHLSPTRATHVERGLGDAVDVIVDGGPTSVGIESTVLTLASEPPEVLRPGAVEIEELRACLGPVELAEEVAETGARPSPGMDALHYSPAADLEIVDRGTLEAQLSSVPETVGVLWRGDRPEAADSDEIVDRCLPEHAGDYAAGLYDALHELDDAGCRRIRVEAPPSDPKWHAIRDRLRRAAGVAP